MWSKKIHGPIIFRSRYGRICARKPLKTLRTLGTYQRGQPGRLISNEPLKDGHP